MPTIKIKKGSTAGKLKFFVQTKEEAEVLEKARSYAGDTYTLVNHYLGLNLSKSNAHHLYRKIKTSKNFNGSLFSIPIELWEKINTLAKKYDSGEHDLEVISLSEEDIMKA